MDMRWLERGRVIIPFLWADYRYAKLLTDILCPGRMQALPDVSMVQTH